MSNKSKADRVRSLREEALHALRKGNHGAALTRLAELERLAPTDPEYPQRSAECHRRIGNRADEIAALGRAAELHAEQGAYGKAIALHRMILALEPQHPASEKRIAELVQWQASRVNVAPAPSPGPVSLRTAPVAVSAPPVIVSAPPAAVSAPPTSVPATTTLSGAPARRRLDEVLRRRRVEQPRPREEDEGEAIAPPEPEDWFSLADLLEPEDQTFPEVEITSLRLTEATTNVVDLDDELPSDARAS